MVLALKCECCSLNHSVLKAEFVAGIFFLFPNKFPNKKAAKCGFLIGEKCGGALYLFTTLSMKYTICLRHHVQSWATSWPQ